MRVGLFAARKPARGAYSEFLVGVWELWWSRGVARFLRWCYFSVIVAVPLVGCPVAGARVFLTDGARVGGRMRFHVNNQGRVLPCRAKRACRFGAAFENGGQRKLFLTDTMRLWAWSRVSLVICRRLA